MIRWSTLSSRDRRALALGAFTLGPMLIWALAVGPYLRGIADLADQLAAEREVLRRELEILGSAASYPAAVEEAAGRLLATAPRLFGGENSAVASAALAQHLQMLAERDRVLLTRLEPLPATEAGTGVIALPLRVHGETDLQGLLTLLHGLETSAKLVRVEDLRVQGSRGSAARADQDIEVLSFEFLATGYMLEDAPETPVSGGAESGKVVGS
jgi:hypothetical protein